MSTQRKATPGMSVHAIYWVLLLVGLLPVVVALAQPGRWSFEASVGFLLALLALRQLVAGWIRQGAPQRSRATCRAWSGHEQS